MSDLYKEIPVETPFKEEWEPWWVEEPRKAAFRVIRDTKSVYASGSYIIIHHDVEKNELNADWQMCYDENDGPSQILEKVIDYIGDIYRDEAKVRRTKK